MNLTAFGVASLTISPEQVINALIINAREAMPHGGTVRLAARNVELSSSSTLLPHGRYIKVKISDRGSGVPEELAQRVAMALNSSGLAPMSPITGAALKATMPVCRKVRTKAEPSCPFPN